MIVSTFVAEMLTTSAGHMVASLVFLDPHIAFWALSSLLFLKKVNELVVSF